MYDFTVRDRAALDRLESDTQRMVVRRWAELTSVHSHPEWRLHGRPPRGDDPTTALLRAVDADNSGRAYHAVADVAANMLQAGGNLSWQYRAVRSYLLHGAERSGKSFDERLCDLCPESWTQPDGDPPLTVTLRSESTLPRHAKMPWTGIVPSAAAAGPVGAPITAGTETMSDGSRVFILQTRAAGRDPRYVHEAMARLHFEGTVAVDLARLTVQSPLRLSPQVDVEGAGAPISSLRPPPMPRLDEARLRRIAAGLGERFRAGPDDVWTQRAIAALRWLSLAYTRWQEAPAMAAGLVYIALETAHNGCVNRHRDDGRCGCGDAHPTALERYVETLRDRLASEAEAYLLRTVGSGQGRRAGRRRPEPWMVRTRIKRGGRSIARWTEDLMGAMARAGSRDSLLRFHLAEIHRLHGSRRAAVSARCDRDLAELRMARNALVHDKDLLLTEQRTAYLACLATETTLLYLEAVCVF